jgi:glycosyltransferase involved in cell wall biosynthesis
VKPVLSPVEGRPDVALDVRETSHMSAGMVAYVRALRRWLPRVAPDLRIAAVGTGDNFDLAEQIALPLALARLQPRLVHFPTPYVPAFVPAAHIVTVHDLIDLEFPQYAKRKVGAYWRYLVLPVLRSARMVITDDDATAELLAHHTGVDAKRVRVIPLGVDAPDPLPAPLVGERPYLFYAGNRRPHKDLATLVAAWSTLPERLAIDLVLTGDDDGSLPAVRHPRGKLVFAGARSSEDVWRLHRGALAYVQPALREGFGLPLLEALRAGTPVIAAERAVPAILRPYVQRYPAGDTVALRDALLRVIERPDAFAEGVQLAREQTAHLSWERTARATAGVYRELLDSPSANPRTAFGGPQS